MRRLLNKLFFIDSPEKGVFFGFVLLFLGTWILGTVFALCGGIYSLNTRDFGTGKLSPEGLCWVVSSAAVFVLFILYFLFQQGHFWRRFSWKECGAACKKWLLSSFCLWTATLICGGNCCALAAAYGGSDGLFSYVKADAAALPALLTVTLLLLLASMLATAGFLSTSGKFPYREIFTLPVKLLGALVILVYAGMISASLVLQKKCGEEKSALEKHFKRSLSVDVLKKTATENGKESDTFWKKINELHQKDKNLETSYSLAEFTPSQLAPWRKRFESSKIFPELDRMISKPLPPFPRKIEKYNLAAVLLPDLAKVRYMARVQVWHCRFAAEKGDRAAAMAALKRMDHLSSYLAQQSFLISALVKLAIDSYKIRAVEILLGARTLSKDDLLALKQQSGMIRKQLEAVEMDIIWSEALFGLDYIEGAIHSGIWGGIKVVPLRKFRFLLPQFWLIDEGNILNYLRTYRRAKKFYDMPGAKPGTVFDSFVRHIIPVFRRVGNRFLNHDLEQQAIGFFIDQELYRLEHGKLPENLPLPVDPFSKKPMQYIHGKVTVKKEVYRQERQEFTFSARQLTSLSKEKLNVTVTIPDKKSAR